MNEEDIKIAQQLQRTENYHNGISNDVPEPAEAVIDTETVAGQALIKGFKALNDTLKYSKPTGEGMQDQYIENRKFLLRQAMRNPEAAREALMNERINLASQGDSHEKRIAERKKFVEKTLEMESRALQKQRTGQTEEEFREEMEAIYG